MADFFGDIGKGITSGLGGLSDYLVGKDGIGGQQSGALGSIGDYFTGTDSTSGTFGPTGGIVTPSTVGSPSVFSSIGSYAQKNPEIAKLGIQGLGGLGQYFLNKDANKTTADYYSQQMDLSNRYFEDQVTRADAADVRRDDAEASFNDLSGFSNPYSQYAR